MLRLRDGLRHAEKLEDIYLKIWKHIIIRNMRDDTTNKFEKGRPKIRVYKLVDSRFILEDFIAKLEVLYGKGSDTK